MMQVQEEELRSEPAKKRRKLQSPNDPEIEATENLGVSHTIIRSALTSLDRSVSPPLSRRSPQVLGNDAVQETQPPKYEQSVHSSPELQHEEQKGRSAKIIPSPIQLTRIRDLPAPSNIDTVSLEDLLSDPLIREYWQFNYLFNIDFLMYVPTFPTLKYPMRLNQRQPGPHLTKTCAHSSASKSSMVFGKEKILGG